MFWHRYVILQIGYFLWPCSVLHSIPKYTHPHTQETKGFLFFVLIQCNAGGWDTWAEHRKKTFFFRQLSCHWNNLLEIHIHFSFWIINFELSTSLIKAVCRLFILKFESLNMFLCERRKTILDQVTEPWPCISPVPSFQTKWLLKHKNLQVVKRRKVSMQNFLSNNRDLF